MHLNGATISTPLEFSYKRGHERGDGALISGFSIVWSHIVFYADGTLLRLAFNEVALCLETEFRSFHRTSLGSEGD